MMNDKYEIVDDSKFAGFVRIRDTEGNDTTMAHTYPSAAKIICEALNYAYLAKEGEQDD